MPNDNDPGADDRTADHASPINDRSASDVRSDDNGPEGAHIAGHIVDGLRYADNGVTDDDAGGR